MRTPSLTSNYAMVYRRATAVTVEGRPVESWTLVYTFSCGFGAVNTSREQVVGAAGQRVDAAVSTMATDPDVRVGDKLAVANREWTVVGVRDTGATTRVLLAAWGQS